ncbi:hypothetical protein Tco_0798951 [Tanacetum coccineum]
MIPKTERLLKYMELDVSPMEWIALHNFFCSSLPLKIDFCGLELVSIRRIQGIGYGVLGFLGVGTTIDIFQNLHILYLRYGVLPSSGYGVLACFLHGLLRGCILIQQDADDDWRRRFTITETKAEVQA